jgi:predicted O-methyltransferase YrrM
MRLAPDSLAGDAGYRALLATASRRLRPAGRSSAALASALWTTALGRVPPEERAWLDRIAAYRTELTMGGIRTTAAADSRGLDPAARDREAAAACLWMSLPPVLGTLLMRLVRELRPSSCLELGTGFGVSAAYQAAALELNGSGTLTSLDIADMTRIAEPALARIGLGERVSLHSGMIEDTLANAVTAAAPIEYALLDADHTEAGTIEAFEGVVAGAAPGAILAFDDINWTDEMARAWGRIRSDDRIETAISIRRLGIAVIAPSGAHR